MAISTLHRNSRLPLAPLATFAMDNYTIRVPVYGFIEYDLSCFVNIISCLEAAYASCDSLCPTQALLLLSSPAWLPIYTGIWLIICRCTQVVCPIFTTDAPQMRHIVNFAIRRLCVSLVVMHLRAPIIFLLSARPFRLSVLRTCNFTTKPREQTSDHIWTSSLELHGACFLMTRGFDHGIKCVVLCGCITPTCGYCGWHQNSSGYLTPTIWYGLQFIDNMGTTETWWSIHVRYQTIT